MATVLDAWARAELSALDAAMQRRVLDPLHGPQGAHVLLGGSQPLLNFSSNDYLGLANHQSIIEAGRRALEVWGAGAGASRLVVGDTLAHQSLERRLAAFENSERALVFSSGYAANVGVLSALLGDGDVVFSDELNHASIIDGCRLSRARVRVFRHGDVEHLESLVKQTDGRRRLVVTDSVFSMDGDVAPLRELAAVCARHGLALMVDEAHATGVLGPRGNGACEAAGVAADIRVGTLSKALGAVGAWVGGSALLCDLLVNRARSFVFSTGLAPAVCAMAERAVDVVERDESLRRRLWANIEQLGLGLRTLGLEQRMVEPQSAIFSLVLGAEKRALAASAELRRQGVLVKAIRPPTVAEGTSRLRISVSAAHTPGDIEQLLHCLRGVVA